MTEKIDQFSLAGEGLIPRAVGVWGDQDGVKRAEAQSRPVQLAGLARLESVSGFGFRVAVFRVWRLSGLDCLVCATFAGQRLARECAPLPTYGGTACECITPRVSGLVFRVGCWVFRVPGLGSRDSGFCFLPWRYGVGVSGFEFHV